MTRWVWDGNKPLHEWQELELDGRNTDEVITWLFEEESFAPLAKLTSAGAYSVVCDHLGTPLELLDAGGAAIWRAQLDSYGGVREGQGTPQDCPFRYQGQYEDAETGLYYNRFRYYDPEAGQYISQDPIGLLGGLAAYAYVADPTAWVDPFGLTRKKGGCTDVGDRLKNGFRKGYDEASIAKITPRNWENPSVVGRPNPKKYLKKRYIDQHLDHFQGEASYLVTGDVYSARIKGAAEVGRADGLFIATKTDIDGALARANGDIAILEKELGIPEGSWQNHNGMYRVDIQNPEKFGLRMPSGNEDAANKLWKPGGLTPEGIREAVTNPIPASNTNPTKVI